MKFRTILIFLILPILSFSQNYEKTLKDGKKWHISEQVGMGGVANHYYVTSCDTIINAKHYFQIHEAFNSGANFSPVLGFVREDTLAQKVYFLDTNSSNEELISDYTLTVGDSFNFTWYTPAFKLPVVQVDTVFINQAMRKVVHFYGYGQGPYLRFIQGVGNGFWGIYRNYNSFAAGEVVWAVDENTGINCSTILPYKIIQQQESSIHVYPNPFKQTISIEIESPSSHNQIGTIYNSLGQQIQRFEIHAQKELSLAQLVTGVYFVQIGNSPSIKIIKEH